MAGDVPAFAEIDPHRETVGTAEMGVVRLITQ